MLKPIRWQGRAISGILNKLTVEKFDMLYEKLITETGICSETHIEELMKQIFHKATTQHHFISMSAASRWSSGRLSFVPTDRRLDCWFLIFRIV